jgi:cysteine sulfinate desulfinase/cysteine desulfurase-like protein
MGIGGADAAGALRFSLGRSNDAEDVAAIVAQLEAIVARVRL